MAGDKDVEVIVGASSVERAKNVVIAKSIVIGNEATRLAVPVKRPSDEKEHTHQWKLYLRPYNQENLTRFVRKVQFKLHDSYDNHTRVVEQPPFEITETGWGEFEVQLRIYFVDSNEKPVTTFHYLRLFEQPTTAKSGNTVVNDYYDEIVFREPTMVMYKILTDESAVKKHDPKLWVTDFSHVYKRTSEVFKGLREELNDEINDLRESLKLAHQKIEKYRREMENADSNPSTPGVTFSIS
uniref:Protein AF-9 homolog n=1 Tax=Steinernema glaseri TaxID=37863 RepID=A0A1I7ZDC8_9BILA